MYRHNYKVYNLIFMEMDCIMGYLIKKERIVIKEIEF